MANMTYEEFCQQFSLQLSSQQADAVQAVSGPILLLAVPGSGKTTVLVARLGYLIYCAGIAPKQILTLTYTVAATKDMAARFASFFGRELMEQMEFRTINGLCAKVIGCYGDLIGKRPFSLVTEEKRIIAMLSGIYRQVENKFATESDLKDIRTRITYIKNRMLTDREIGRLEREAGCRLGEIYRAYCGELRRQELMDYDDQMVYACRILENSPETLAHFRDRYRYLCVDEAQDTSRIQHQIISLLAGERDNLFLVGDEDQSIYGFRAAYPEALLDFEQNHPGARVLLMEDNYRSNAKIVGAADYLIRQNRLRHEKHMRAVREPGYDIRKISLKARQGQYSYLEKVALNCQTQTAVLYRDNESILPLVDLLEREGIPYRIRSGELAFFSHRIVLDIRNIIAFAAHPQDTELFLQIYYKISTYISKENALRICEISRREGRNVLDIAIRYGQLPENTRQSCQAIREHLEELRRDQAGTGINRIIRYMGYQEYLEKVSMSQGKLAILKAIAMGEDSLESFVARLDELQGILREKKEDADCRFILSTIHASKGLEYDTVYLMDVEDGIFPENVPERFSDMDREERKAFEEERRLFYVGVTRARDRLCIFQWGRSVFCRELMQGVAACGGTVEMVELLNQKKGVRKMAGEGKVTGVRNPFPARGMAKSWTMEDRNRAVSQEEYGIFCNAIGEGLLVRHKKWGEGVVVEMEGDRISIRFGEELRKFDLQVLYAHKLLEL